MNQKPGTKMNAEEELAQIKAILSDPNAVRLNLLRGTIAWTPETLRSVLGDDSGGGGNQKPNQKNEKAQ